MSRVVNGRVMDDISPPATLPEAMMYVRHLEAEIARLREEVRYEIERNEGNVALNQRSNELLRAEIERLRGAIKAEASRHINTLPIECGASLMCECEICRIAREGK